MRVSVLTPTIRGREGLLRRASFSVRWQTWNLAIEHVIVEGDGLSPAQAFQQCLVRARGDLVMPLADDDWLAPHALETLTRLLRDGTDFASGRTLVTGNGSDTIVGELLSSERFAAQGFVFGGAHMWHRSLTDTHGGFDPDYPNAADYDLYWRLSKVCKPAFTSEILYVHTDHPAKDSAVNQKAAEKQYTAIRKHHLGEAP